MLSFIISRLVILIFGTLYPAYASYKAVKTKDIKEYVKWMMYWIVFAFFTAGEIFLDVFLSFWFPFYYELKIMFVVWLLCPATKGSNFMYRKFVHPLLSKREKDIDDYLERCKEDGYSAVLKLGSKAVSVATNTFIETAVRLHTNGLLQGLRKSYSVAYLNDQNYDLGNQDVMYDRKISMSRSSLATDLPSPSEPIFSAYRRDFGGSLEALNEPISRPRRVSTRRTELRSTTIKKRTTRSSIK